MNFRCIAVLPFLIVSASASDLLYSTLGRTFTTFNALGGPGSFSASDFITDGSSSFVTGFTVRLWGDDDIPHTVTAYILSNGSNNLPADVVHIFDTSLTLPASPGGNLSNPGFYSGTDSGFTLEPNTRYWFALTANELASQGGVGTFWAAAPPTSGVDDGSRFQNVDGTKTATSVDNGATYQNSFPGNYGYSLVPEPCTALLVGIGGIIIVQRRRPSP